MNLKNINPWWYAGGIAFIILLVAFLEFFFHKDKGCISGMQAMGQLSTGFWIWFIILLAAAGLTIFYLVRKYRKDGNLDTGSIQTLMAVAALFMFISMLKAGDVKANCGTTGTKGNPENQVPKDDGRVPAQDLIPKQ